MTNTQPVTEFLAEVQAGVTEGWSRLKKVNPNNPAWQKNADLLSDIQRLHDIVERQQRALEKIAGWRAPGAQGDCFQECGDVATAALSDCVKIAQGTEDQDDEAPGT